MSTIKITIPLKPRPKGSVRSTTHFYNPSAKGMKVLRERTKLELKPDFQLFKGPLLVIAHFKLPVPKTGTLARQRRHHGFPHISRPDGDNLEKFLNDSLTGLVWRDDSIIAWLVRSKSLTALNDSSTTLFVRELDFAKPNYELILSDIKEHIYLENDHETTE